MALTFQVFIDHVQADAALARRLQTHLTRLVKKGQVKLLLADGVPAGLAPARVAREAVYDADLVLALLSVDAVADEDAYGRLCAAHARHQEHRLHLIAVRAGPYTPDPPDDLPGLRALPSDRPLSQYQDLDVPCAAIVARVQEVFDLWERYPPSERARQLAEEAFRLDRIAQWEDLQRHRSGHALFLLYGRVGQAIDLFAARICSLLEHRGGAPVRVLTIPIRSGVANAHDLEGHLRAALCRALGDSDTTAALLQRLAQRSPLFLVLGGVQSQRWPERERQALVDFLTRLLPPLLPVVGHPVQALLMFEYEREETSLLPWISQWAAALPAPLRYHELAEATLPTWEEVLAVLQKKGAAAEIITAMREFYQELQGGAAPSFERLASALEEYLT